jgi:non-heme chloroperoxidase
MVFLASDGYHCIAHDRRGHGRSSQPWNGNEMDTDANDLSELIETLNLKGAVLFGFSAGGGEVARYIGRQRHETGGQGRTDLHRPAADAENGSESRRLADRGVRQDPTWLPRRPLAAPQGSPSGPFFGANRHGAKVSQVMIDSFWLQGMQAGHQNTFAA